MYKKYFPPINLWQFDLLDKEQGLMHFVSGRDGGVTSGDKGGLNLSFKVDDEVENVKENRALLAAALSINNDKLVFPVQTHSVNIKLIKTGNENMDDTDALISSTKGICIAVMSADCVPVLLYDPIRRSCAAIHSGWKGTVGKILYKTIDAMKENYGTQPSDLIACIGPSICPEVYEVGNEVVEEVEKAFGKNEVLLRPAKVKGKAYLNLWEANKLQLISAGVKETNIEIAGICTYKNADQFFSARRSKNNTGRFAAGIMLL